ncbi:hypothetical protein ASF70_15645 [Rhizobium sp. Leaf321]|uniref:hypothetical protein n=1 Tax=Rhizobium sp. Leaf321 TaxID=1736335 RepID=UPI000714A06B|nr:hypothetical protein [Rhizobium sp. Leaf321]KQQ72905.1 hypothetical protein ASF70_15645 [Rhizobium sp. Leaf321]
MPFLISRAKVARAQNSTTELSALFAENRYSPFQFTLIDAIDRERRLVRLEYLEAPIEAFVIVAEIANHLRSALDIAVADLARDNGKELDKQIGFPNSKSSALWAAECHKRTKLLSPSAQDFVEALNVHPGGDLQLYGLTQLDNFGKHKDAVIVAGDLEVSNLSGVNHKHPGALYAGEISGLLAAQDLKQGRTFQNGNLYDFSTYRMPTPSLLSVLNGAIPLSAIYSFAVTSKVPGAPVPRPFPGEPVVATLKGVTERVTEVLDLMEKIA